MPAEFPGTSFMLIPILPNRYWYFDPNPEATQASTFYSGKKSSFKSKRSQLKVMQSSGEYRSQRSLGVLTDYHVFPATMTLDVNALLKGNTCYVTFLTRCLSTT